MSPGILNILVICLALKLDLPSARDIFDSTASSDASSVVNRDIFLSRVLHLNYTLSQRGEQIFDKGLWLQLIAVFLF